MNWYINKAAEKNLKEYQYDGADLSILYKLALSPFAQFLVDHFVPSWMAPNLITLIGLLIQLVTFGIVTAYCPLFCGDNETPRWVYVLIAASLFAYQTLDNMDGKQARKTGSSTPLGMIFDHSCDAINAIIGACMACTLFLCSKLQFACCSNGNLNNKRPFLLCNMGGVLCAQTDFAAVQRAF